MGICRGLSPRTAYAAYLYNCPSIDLKLAREDTELNCRTMVRTVPTRGGTRGARAPAAAGPPAHPAPRREWMRALYDDDQGAFAERGRSLERDAHRGAHS